jgi:polyphosphate kinase 2 (PPK2 family)
MATKDKHEQHDAEARAPAKMKRKEYERQMRILHGELVAMQEWVKETGAKVCVVFEGRDTAGKGGTIKRITERVSPRVFRAVALPTRPNGKSRKCMCSAMYSTSRPPARS